MLGMKPDDPAYTTGNIIETIHPDDRPAYREAIVAHFRGDTPRFEVDFRYRGATGAGAGAASTASRCAIPTGTPIASSAR